MNCFQTRIYEYQPPPHYRSFADTDFFGNPSIAEFQAMQSHNDKNVRGQLLCLNCNYMSQINNVRKLINVLFAGKNQLWG
jgi:hypothetical protein